MNLRGRAVDPEEKHDGLELLAQRLQNFSVDYSVFFESFYRHTRTDTEIYTDKTITDLVHNVSNRLYMGGVGITLWLSTMSHEIIELSTLLKNSTMELNTVAVEFAEAKKDNVTDLDKLRLHLRTEVGAVVRLVGTILETIAHAMFQSHGNFIMSRENLIEDAQIR
jgi:hypothetical protein